MSLPILVTGGTGTLGRLVAPLLRDRGSSVRVLSRMSHPSEDGIEFVTGDLATGQGIDAAVNGVATIVHCAGSATGDADKARTLVRAASDAGVRHLVYISVVGAGEIPIRGRLDRAVFGYYGAKYAAEGVVATSAVPWTTLCTTQFHDLLLALFRAMARLPVIPVPTGWRFQPIDTAEVAARLVELSLAAPSGRVPDMAGPRVHGMDELLRSYLAATHRARVLTPLPLPGKAARAFKAGANLAPDRAVGRRTWEDFLTAHVNEGQFDGG